MPNNNPKGGPQWTEEHCNELVLLLATGIPYRKIAEALNEKFATSYSKNSVVGKISRLGLTPPEKPKRPPYVRPSSHKSKGIRAYVARRATHNSNAMHMVPVFNPVQMTCDEIIPQHVSFDDYTGCAFPYGDGPFTFCNNPKFEGSASYCLGHHFHCHKPPQPLHDRVMRREVA